MFLSVSERKIRRKYEDRWQRGIYLGLVERSNMVLVGTVEGVKKVNCIRRLPPMQAKNKVLVLSMQGVPWKLSPAESPGTLDDVPTMVATEAIVEEDELPPPPAPAGERSGKRRRVYIRREIELESMVTQMIVKGALLLARVCHRERTMPSVEQELLHAWTRMKF